MNDTISPQLQAIQDQARAALHAEEQAREIAQLHKELTRRAALSAEWHKLYLAVRAAVPPALLPYLVWFAEPNYDWNMTGADVQFRVEGHVPFWTGFYRPDKSRYEGNQYVTRYGPWTQELGDKCWRLYSDRFVDEAYDDHGRPNGWLVRERGNWEGFGDLGRALVAAEQAEQERIKLQAEADARNAAERKQREELERQREEQAANAKLIPLCVVCHSPLEMEHATLCNDCAQIEAARWQDYVNASRDERPV